MLEDEFGDIIRKARMGLGLDLKESARRSDLRPAVLEAYENLKAVPSQVEIRSLAEILKLDAEKLETIAQKRFVPEPHEGRQGGFIYQAMVVSNLAGWQSNCYLLNFTDSKAALVVDPGAEPKRILAALDSQGWEPAYIALTHGHGDHVGALRGVLRRWPVPVLVGKGDRNMIGRISSPVLVMEEGQTVEVGDHAIQARLTPGHTLGGVCYAFEGGCFVGDSLFAGSVGRPNVEFYYERYLASIREKVLSLPEDTLIFPGHGPVTSVKEERRFNPFF